MVKRHNYWVVLLTFVIALMLTITPLPDSMNIFRPAWVAMVLIYWSLALPHRVSIMTAFLLGILLDVLQGSLLGQHAIGLSVIAFVTTKLHLQVRIQPLYQQALFVGLLIAVQSLLVAWVNGVIGHETKSWSFLLPVLSSMLLWPWLFIILRDIRRKAQVS